MKMRETLLIAAAILRLLVVVTLTLFVAVLYYRANLLRELLWLSAALIIGFVLNRWWILLVAAVPWLLGMGVAWLTGHYASLENWKLLILPSEASGSVGVGIFGLGVGLLLHRWNWMPA